MAKSKKAPAGLSYASLVAAQGGSAVNRQTGAVTTAPGYTSPSSSSVKQGSGGSYYIEGGDTAGNAKVSSGATPASSGSVTPTPSAPTPAQIPGQPFVTPAVSPVTTSDPARDSYASLKDQINKIANSSLDYGKYLNSSDPMFGMLEQRREQLAQRRDAEMNRINQEFGQAQAQQKQEQKSEVGTQSMGLARMGGFDSASGQAVLTNLERVHESEQQALFQARQSALLQAQQAYEDQDFELARLQIEEAKAAEALMYNRQQDYIRNVLAIRGEERADAQMQLQQAQFAYAQQRDRIEDERFATDFALNNYIKDPFYFIGGEARDTKTGERLSYDDYIARGGKPDFSNAMVIEPGSKEARAYVFDLATKFPDAGIDPRTDDVSLAQTKIQSSRIYKEMVRPPSSGGGSSKQAMISSLLMSAKANLDSQRSSSGDGFANPDTYRDNKTAYVSAGGTAADFFQMFPPEVYIAPENRKGDLDVYKANNGTDPLVQQFQAQFGIPQ